MKNRIHFNLTEQASAKLEAIMKKANDGFKDGEIDIPSCLNFLIETANPDVSSLQAKQLDPRRVLLNAADEKDRDYEALIAKLRKLQKVASSTASSVSKGEREGS